MKDKIKVKATSGQQKCSFCLEDSDINHPECIRELGREGPNHLNIIPTRPAPRDAVIEMLRWSLEEVAKSRNWWKFLTILTWIVTIFSLMLFKFLM